jgi:hypothetical protein
MFDHERVNSSSHENHPIGNKPKQQPEDTEAPEKSNN